MSIQIVGVGGSVRRTSTSLAALELALEGARDVGADIVLLNLAELSLPWYDPQETSIPLGARRLADLAASSAGMIWSTPTYHGTVSGVFKNAMDWLQLLAREDPPYLSEKPVGLIATGAGVRTAQSLNTMGVIAQALRAWPVPMSIAINESHIAYNASAELQHDGTADQLRTLGRLVERAARRFTMDPAEAAGLVA